MITGTVDFSIGSRYRMPAAFEPHSCTWLLWPTRPDNWRLNASLAQMAMASLTNQLSKFEPVILGKDPKQRVENLEPKVRIVDISYNDIWVRDTGPTILTAGEGDHIAIDWRFNSWGGLFDSSNEDDTVAKVIADYHGIRCYRGPIVLEGGAILSDGAGTLFTTEEAVTAPNRNPGLERDEADEIFANFLNCRNIVWFPRGLANDEAGGHIDNLIGFANPRKVLLASCKDSSHPSYHRLLEAKQIMAMAHNTKGESYEIVEVPLPNETAITEAEADGFEAPAGQISRSAGTPLAPSYINYYLANESVFVPIFECATDSEALELFGNIFPDRTVVPVQSREFLLGGGALHCITCEIPR